MPIYCENISSECQTGFPAIAWKRAWLLHGVRELTWRSLIDYKALMVDLVVCRCTLTLGVMQASHL